MKTSKPRLRAQLPTKLEPDEMDRVQKLVLLFLRENEFIRNKKLRDISGIGYDQAIHFFGNMIAAGLLKKTGTGAATRYSLTQV